MEAAATMTTARKKGGAPLGNKNGAKPWLEPSKVVQVYLSADDKQLLIDIAEGSNRDIATIVAKAVEKVLGTKKQPDKKLYTVDEVTSNRGEGSARLSLRLRVPTIEKLIEIAPKRQLTRSQFLRLVIEHELFSKHKQ